MGSSSLTANNVVSRRPCASFLNQTGVDTKDQHVYLSIYSSGIETWSFCEAISPYQRHRSQKSDERCVSRTSSSSCQEMHFMGCENHRAASPGQTRRLIFGASSTKLSRPEQRNFWINNASGSFAVPDGRQPSGCGASPQSVSQPLAPQQP